MTNTGAEGPGRYSDETAQSLGLTETPNYWQMSDADLATAWREVDNWSQTDGYSLENDPDGERIETLNMVEDAILQRIGAPEHASGDEPRWQQRIRQFGEAQ